MVMRKTGSSADQQVTETDSDEGVQGIAKAAAAGGQRELTPQERDEIIRGEEN
jgi:hypothetical protein